MPALDPIGDRGHRDRAGEATQKAAEDMPAGCSPKNAT